MKDQKHSAADDNRSQNSEWVALHADTKGQHQQAATYHDRRAQQLALNGMKARAEAHGEAADSHRKAIHANLLLAKSASTDARRKSEKAINLDDNSV